MLGYVDLRFS